MRFPAPVLDCMENTDILSTLIEKHLLQGFLFRVEDDSMINAHIPKGALLAVDKHIKPASGMIIIAEIEGAVVVRRLVKTLRLTVLHPENAYYKPLTVTAGMNMIIYGVVMAILITCP
jgi:DNA polymerase V